VNFCEREREFDSKNLTGMGVALGMAVGMITLFRALAHNVSKMSELPAFDCSK